MIADGDLILFFAIYTSLNTELCLNLEQSSFQKLRQVRLFYNIGEGIHVHRL